jgi:hypothetical protein
VSTLKNVFVSLDSDPLRSLLESFESEGERSDEGAFTLDPKRATEILRGQGRLGRNAPLYLLSAIYQHTQGQSITPTFGSRYWRLEWDSAAGPLSGSLEWELAKASFATHQIDLHSDDSGVQLQPSGPRTRAAKILEPLFLEVAERTEHYPWPSFRPRWHHAILGLAQHDGATIQLHRAKESAPPRWVQVVHGIAYPRRWTLPIDAVCFDSKGRPDLTLTVIPHSARQSQLELAARRCFDNVLLESLQSTPGTLLLDPVSLSEDLPLFAIYLAYAVVHGSHPDVVDGVAAKVAFADATGRPWTLGELLEVYARDGKLMIVPSQPKPDVPAGQRGHRPVLLWGGQAEQSGQKLFPHLTSGAGYLYSLVVNEKERQRSSAWAEPCLASSSVRAGRLSLLPWGEPDHTAEVEFVGPRRARETYYLDIEAPKGLRLLWESEQSLEEDSRELALELPLRQTVLELVDASLDTFTPSRETVVAALAWVLTKGPLEWNKLARLASLPLFDDVEGRLWSVARLQAWPGRLPVLMDRSTSLPSTLPDKPLLWWHPLFEGLDIATEDAGRRVREAHWQETGRQRWLAAHRPSAPDWPAGSRAYGVHRVAPNPCPEAPTEVVFWRQGRPFGRRILPVTDCPPGCLVMWVEDELPGDIYWSGPQATALTERLPAIAELCRKAKAAL